jgi:hypothetical protein
MTRGAPANPLAQWQRRTVCSGGVNNIFKGNSPTSPSLEEATMDLDIEKLKTMAAGGLIGGGIGLLAGILGSVASSASFTALILPLSIGVVAGAFMAWQGYYG